MKKNYLLNFIIILIAPLINAAEIQKSNINPNLHVILLGTYAGINDARRFANNFKNETVYILEGKDYFTVRIVNIETKELALEKLVSIKRNVPDAMIWKKMKFIKPRKFNKLHSQIYTIDSTDTIKSKNKSEG
ncbi:hypothetical protein A9Q76_09735 [Arcobacter sp. 31_11_sub10_T18]|nr:hypothetical protein A9Q76_09735 [Arcobacter sp. 31_11_sub10_T18]